MRELNLVTEIPKVVKIRRNGSRVTFASAFAFNSFRAKWPLKLACILTAAAPTSGSSKSISISSSSGLSSLGAYTHAHAENTAI